MQPFRETKSVSVEDTYQEDLTEKAAMSEELTVLAERLSTRLQRSGLKGRTVTVKFKLHDFTIMTRSLSLLRLINDKESITESVTTILDKTDLENKRVRLLGVGLSNFNLPIPTTKKNTDRQLKLF